MKEESFIRKIQPDSDGLDFEGLRRKGIGLAQDVSDELWTDYNLHDPGVTILEQLCYGLTDMVYRTGFDVADYLSSSDGQIDFERLALHRPDEIFSSGPVTESDYRKLILDALPGIDNVWVGRATSEAGNVHGLYRVYLLPAEVMKDRRADDRERAYADMVARLYAANRNLCEDLLEVRIVESIPYVLHGEIEIDGARAPSSIFAEIHFVCAQYLSPKVAMHAYPEMHRDGHSLEELFTGTLTGHGYIADRDLHPWRAQFSVQEVAGKIGRIEGVKTIRHLAFADAQGRETDYITLDARAPFEAVARLQFPQTDAECVRLYKAGHPYHVSLRDAETEFGRLNYANQARRSQKQAFDWVDALLPAATFRGIGDYFSIQNHFPDIYGLNAGGVPDTASRERKAQAMQLKAYLLLFEQLMANGFQNLQQIPRLFSLDEQLRQTYFHQTLKSDAIPGVEAIYQQAEQVDGQIAALLAKFDDYGSRRNRVLDYLLGLYGEKFYQNSLCEFFGENVDADEVRIGNKLAFLKKIVSAGRNRALAVNYLEPSAGQENASGLAQRLNTLLSLQPADGEWWMVEHVLLRPTARPFHEGCNVPDDFYSFRVSVIFPSASGRFAHAGFRALAEETLDLNCPAHIHSEIVWAESWAMERFKALHGDWLAAKRSNASPGRTDDAARALILFLLDIGARRT